MDQPNPHKVKEIFDVYFDAGIEFWEGFVPYLQMMRFSKGEIIKDYNKKENYIYLLTSGSVGQFVLSNAKDICINLYYENQIFSDYYSFLTQLSTSIKLECIKKAEVWAISYSQLQTLYASSTKGLMIGKAVSEAMFIRKQKEQINLLTLSPIERYIQLIENRPKIFQYVPLKVIASYLGITPESLSRLRKKIT